MLETMSDRMTMTEREKEISHLVDQYNRGPGNPKSPFIARADGKLDEVAKQIGVPTQELNAFLTKVEKMYLPPV